MRKKQIISRLLKNAGVFWLIENYRSYFLKQIPILTYHRILDIDDPIHYPFDSNLVSDSVAGFDQQMRYISKNYNPVSFEDLHHHVEHNKPLPQKPIIITFDDGFIDNYTNAFPILKKYDLKATMFVATDHISSGDTFWYEQVTYIIKKLPTDRLVIKSIDFDIAIDKENRLNTIYFCLESFKKLQNTQRLQAIEELKATYADCLVCFADDCKKYSHPFDWNQCLEMSQNNIEIGSHTVTHPILSKLKPEELDFELRESKKVIEKKLQQQVYAIAYPNGGVTDYNDNVIQSCIENDYKYAATFHGGINTKKDLQTYALKRICIEPAHDTYMLPFSLSFPSY